MNSVNLIGRLVRDPELRYTQSQQAVCSFTLAVDKGLSRDKREELESAGKPTADFPRIMVWGKQGENVSRYLSKGSQCGVIGRIQTGSYQDKETGKTIYTTDIIADRIEFLSSQNNAQNNAGTTREQNRSNYTSGNSKSYTGQNNDDFFEDDFQEVQDDGRIPF
ncbi:single-stranded DNA-binding protein [Anaerococcus marasmi]|uniref:single-stranded DNA-binding protein n=1 Tax=Anaerococcus marasmi TaxID=2057797 RepID=UPI000CF9B35E|nr:single-stranded DNA-binding protein [Anaerococcus marasmi]